MKVEDFVHILGSDFFTGVPDSQLKPLCNYLMHHYGVDPKHHIIAANEGNCTAIAAGYHLSTKKIPVVYMQNSGEGNIINPVASLLNQKVYSIPVVFVIGWRGEPGVHDEPQHIFQGEITPLLLSDLNISYFIISPDTTVDELNIKMTEFHALLNEGKSVAFIIRKNALSFDKKVEYSNTNHMLREEIIQHIVKFSKEDPIVSTTGKASRELFETRANSGQSHKYDFLTVGSMGHSSSIALGLALQKEETRFWCIDGDGAALMHLGAMAVIGAYKPKNLIHIVINNGAHETVGGMPTVANEMNLSAVAFSCGYPYSATVDNINDLDAELEQAVQRNQLSFLEVKCAIGSRLDLGRPKTSAMENKNCFMEYLSSL